MTALAKSTADFIARWYAFYRRQELIMLCNIK